MADVETEQLEPEETENKAENEPVEENSVKELLLSDYLSDEFTRVLVDFMTSAYNSGSLVLTLRGFISQLLLLPEVSAYNRDNNIDTVKILEGVKSDETVENQSRGIVILSPDLKGKILEVFAYGIHVSHNVVSPLSFWENFLKLDSEKAENPVKQEMPQMMKYLAKMLPDRQKEIIGRDTEVESILRILMKQEKQNVIMVGDFGIGKTAIVTKLMNKLNSEENSIDPAWKNYEFYKVNSSELINLIKYQLDYEKDHFAEMANVTNKIFYFPNIDLDPVTRDPMVIEYLFNLFIRNRSNRVIMACSPATFQKFVARNNYFGKFFEIVNIQEPPKDDLTKIIALQLDKYKELQGLTFSDNLIEDLIDYSKRFIPAKVFPHKALNLLDEVVVAARLKQKTNIASEDLREVLAQKTGIPIQSIGTEEKEMLLQLEGKMNQAIIGQPLAVAEVVQAIQSSRVGLRNPNHPVGSFLFMGPTGVGKTEFAKQLAKNYYNDEKAFMRFDMSEYSEPQASQKLIGAPPGFAGYDEGGTLTNYVNQHPYSLLLFDEVEKADPHIYDLFLQILDDGRLTDAKGVLVDFKNTILIFTSNIGSDIIAANAANQSSKLFTDTKAFFNDEIFPQLSKYMRVEFINRFDIIIPFVPLSPDDIYKILLLKLERVRAAIKKQGYEIEFDEAGLQELVKLGYDPKFGAREIDRVVNTHVENQIAKLLLSNDLKPGDKIMWKFN